MQTLDKISISDANHNIIAFFWQRLVQTLNKYIDLYETIFFLAKSFCEIVSRAENKSRFWCTSLDLKWHFFHENVIPTQRSELFRQAKQGEKQAKRSWFILFLKNAHNIYEDKNNFAFSKWILTHCVVLHCSETINGQGSS